MLATTFCCVVFSVYSLKAQNFAAPEASDALWSRIETQLAQQPSDTSFQCILDLVQRQCGKDYTCLHTAFNSIMVKLERQSKLAAAIFVGEEIVKITHFQKDLAREAMAHHHLSRYYNSTGQHQLALMNIEKAIKLSTQADAKSEAIKSKFLKLSYSLEYRKLKEVLPEMESLLDEALPIKDMELELYLHRAIIADTRFAYMFKEMSVHIDFLEKMLPKYPIRSEIIYEIARGKADQALFNKNFEEAERFYLQALDFAKARPDHWRISAVLLALAELEWGRNRATAAKIYLEKALMQAESFKFDDLLVDIYSRKTEFAEAEGRYKDAYLFSQKQAFHEEKSKIKSVGLDRLTFYHQMEKDQLAAEKERQNLELRLKKSQLLYSLISVALAILLAAGFVFAFYKQRKAKKELEVKNDLIQKQSEQLQSLDTAKSRFFANVSHELRTPLTLMLGPIGTLLKDKHLTEKQTNLLQMADQSGKQLQHLVTDILDLGKLEMGKMELNEKPTELAAFFRTNFAQFESLAASKQIDFSVDMAVDNDVVALLDQAKCRQILNNLLSNAFKFTPTGEHVAAKLSLNDGTLQLSVADTGPGIHPDDLPHLFDRYFQTTRPDKPAEGGTGIGLALCQQNAQLFGGEIEVESTLGQGTTFKVMFPVSLVDNPKTLVVTPEIHFAARQSQSAPTDTPATSSDKAKPSILVVEDNPDLQAYIRLILSEKYQVVTAENGQAALGVMSDELEEMAASTGVLKTHNSKLITPDLILSDLMMPVMDGHQLLEKLKSDDATRHIPVIMLTARADARDKLKALRIGVDDYLLKPFDEEELLARIENLLKNQAARREAAVDESVAHLEGVPHLSQPDREWLETFEAYIQKHLSSDMLSVSALAHEFAMSESTLLRQLKRLTGLSPVQYIQEMRLDEARRLLESRRYNSIAQLASKVGYEDARSFSRSFKQRFGKLPSDMMGE